MDRLPEDIYVFDSRLEDPTTPMPGGHLRQHRVLARLAGLDEPDFATRGHKHGHALLRDWYESETGERLPEPITLLDHIRQHEKLHRHANRMLEMS